MNVKELIEHLLTLDPDMRVFVPGYEGGYDDVKVSEPYTFYLNVNEEWYYGPHEINSNMPDEWKPKYEQVKGIIL